MRKISTGTAFEIRKVTFSVPVPFKASGGKNRKKRTKHRIKYVTSSLRVLKD